MAPTPEQTELGYHRMWDRAQIAAGKLEGARKIARAIIANRARYAAVEAATYVRDGVYDPDHWDAQAGCVALIKALAASPAAPVATAPARATRSRLVAASLTSAGGAASRWVSRAATAGSSDRCALYVPGWSARPAG